MNPHGMKSMKILPKYCMKSNGKADHCPINSFSFACTDDLIFPVPIFLLLIEDPLSKYHLMHSIGNVYTYVNLILYL